MSRSPLARAQRRIREARKMVLATRHEIPEELMSPLHTAANDLLAVEDGIAKELGQAPPARERRES